MAGESNLTVTFIANANNVVYLSIRLTILCIYSFITVLKVFFLVAVAFIVANLMSSTVRTGPP